MFTVETCQVSFILSGICLMYYCPAGYCGCEWRHYLWSRNRDFIEDDVATTETDAGEVFCFCFEEQIVLKDLTDLPTAKAPLYGLIYVLNKKYSTELKYMSEAIQKVFMYLDTKISAGVQSFRNKLLKC